MDNPEHARTTSQDDDQHQPSTSQLEEEKMTKKNSLKTPKKNPTSKDRMVSYNIIN